MGQRFLHVLTRHRGARVFKWASAKLAALGTTLNPAPSQQVRSERGTCPAPLPLLRGSAPLAFGLSFIPLLWPEHNRPQAAGTHPGLGERALGGGSNQTPLPHPLLPFLLWS